MKKFEELAFVNGSYEVVDTSYGAIRIGIYEKYLERWLRYFPIEQFLFVSGKKEKKLIELKINFHFLGERLISDPAVRIFFLKLGLT